jgi:hypothetical protein
VAFPADDQARGYSLVVKLLIRRRSARIWNGM